jgi:hypothetical protein
MTGVNMQRRSIFLLSMILASHAWSAGSLNEQGEAFYQKYVHKINYTPSTTYNTVTKSYDQLFSEPSPFDVLGHQPIPNLSLSPYVVGNFTSVQDQIAGEGQFDPLVRYEFNDKFRFLSWYEFTGTTQGGAQAAVEYANLEWNPQDNIALIGGKFLSPLGKFYNTLYYPWVNKMTDSPIGFDDNYATPEANIGFQVRGRFLMPHASQFHYSFFLAPGQKVVSEEGMYDYISSRAYMPGRVSDAIYGGRLAFLPMTGVEIGISGAKGGLSLINNGLFVESGTSYSSLGADINYTNDTLDIRGEYIQQTAGTDNYDLLVNHATWSAWYGQVAYKLFNAHWEPVLRYGNASSPNTNDRFNQSAIGLNFWFSPDVAVKCSYEVNKAAVDSTLDSHVVLGQLLFRL